MGTYSLLGTDHPLLGKHILLEFYACSDLPSTRAVMFTLAAEHPVLAALAVLIAGWVARFLRKGYAVRKTFHDQVCCVMVVFVLPADD